MHPHKIERNISQMKKTSIFGGPNTAKRFMNVRKFYEQAYNDHLYYSSPFLSDDIDESEQSESNDDDLNVYNPQKLISKEETPKITFRHNYFDFSDSDSDSKSDEDGFTSPISSPKRSDEILIENPDLDDAAKFISSLKLKKKQNPNSPKNKLTIPICRISMRELEDFEKECRKLEELRMLEAIDSQENDESII
ncbi:hypothetical protein TRFO_24304 [Tritrichomonas foetus]|uniref:Uncharacterized protein n=1 Tax=Tritrichomonas foetus TaxID=1144522 RepID=A0A1J4K7V5_9EUKA|nr:hypothetical protein TRFO_24304 [Tritrichomonas foetus]|eukprot:OHT07479.1 hypothetical protein TRFO_24304 [Tritrichomonas foetus]